MLSILVPIFDFDVTRLIHELNDQALACKIPFEIICFDDGSKDEFKELNREISSLDSVSYTELESNIGRSKIRNLLAEKSNYDNLLFLDCDAKLPSKDFVKKYIIHIEDYHVVYGGRIYEDQMPSASEKYFRWYYGKKRESIGLSERIKSPYKSFMTNNFLIHKKAFLSIRLNEKIVGYGHEDTLFGIRLKENNVIIKHINNPVIHIGLEDFDEYIDKTKEGIKNLLFIGQFVNLGDTVRLYKYLKLVKRYKLEASILWFYRKYSVKLLNHLKKNSPSIIAFDILKLGIILELNKSGQFSSIESNSAS